MKRTHKKTSPSLHPDAFIVAGLVLLLVTVIGFLAAFGSVVFSPEKEKVVACTEEARMCPNGSFVSRTGPLCEFSPCPHNDLPDHRGIVEEPLPVPDTPGMTPQNPGPPKRGGVICTQEVRVCPDGSFVARTGPSCEFAPCPDEMEIDRDR